MSIVPVVPDQTALLASFAWLTALVSRRSESVWCMTPTGSPPDGVTAEAVHRNFRHLARPVFGTERTEQLIARVNRLEDVARVHDLTHLLVKESLCS